VKFSFKSEFSLKEQKPEDLLSAGSGNSDKQAIFDFDLPTYDRKDTIMKRMIKIFTSYRGMGDISPD